MNRRLQGGAVGGEWHDEAVRGEWHDEAVGGEWYDEVCSEYGALLPWGMHRGQCLRFVRVNT